MAAEKKILILFFHPRYEHSRSNRRLLEAASTLDQITIRDQYECYPNYNIDVAQEQELLLAHDIIVWQHPIYWYSCPPLMKLWMDLVLEHGWAYGRGGDKLNGKGVLNAITAGGDFEVYQSTGKNRFSLRQFLAPFDQTAHLCGLTYLPPFVVPGANRLSTENLEDYAIRYLEVLNFLQLPQVDVAKLSKVAYFNDLKFESWQETFLKMP